MCHMLFSSIVLMIRNSLSFFMFFVCLDVICVNPDSVLFMLNLNDITIVVYDSIVPSDQDCVHPHCIGLL